MNTAERLSAIMGVSAATQTISDPKRVHEVKGAMDMFLAVMNYLPDSGKDVGIQQLMDMVSN